MPAKTSANVTAVAEHIKDQLMQSGMSVRQLAKESGINQSHISRVLNGHVGLTPDFLRRLAPYLVGTSYRELMRVAGFIDNAGDESKPETIQEVEQHISNLTADLLAYLAQYSELKFAPATKTNAPQLKSEIETQISVVKTLWSAVREGEGANLLGFMRDDNLLTLASDLSRLSKSQTGIIRALVEEFRR
ncbi:helix-turn-helix transcriptional regulator [Alicyclobacillus acidiphilus]|uniref:helix-turn-helix transcriptional regulator n=1 Tax=Alicyclobacillus acidiphilus TaxID=182455 RepID=UPI00082B9CBD|nr:helix-turn-helix transcriptional regulator [Alicyclobacillus acidiphilus]